GGIGGGVFRVGGGVSAPEIVYKIDPEYSEQARKAKYQGTVVLSLIVQRDGSVRDIQVKQSLGLGLDEKAIEAVKQWRFRPGMKSGQAVDVAAIIEVTFRLL
ncbi:MAG: energy transducer TonB, partial [Acidobacteria bacterium]|nr:energy transducer TonB [Acidobacteriota bacterium]